MCMYVVADAYIQLMAIQLHNQHIMGCLKQQQQQQRKESNRYVTGGFLHTWTIQIQFNTIHCSV